MWSQVDYILLHEKGSKLELHTLILQMAKIILR